MTYRVLACLLMTALALGQTAKPAPPAPKLTARPNSSAETPAPKKTGAASESDPAVITIAGICHESPAAKTATAAKKTPADCKTVVTQSEFEGVVNTLQPNMPPAGRKQLAQNYGMAVALAEQARKQGLDKGPAFEENMKLARLQVLAKAANDAIRKKALEVSDADVDAYYKKNEAAYEEAELQRIYIPKTKQVEPAKDAPPADATKQQPPPEPVSMEKDAEAIQSRAAAGEDFAKLQTDASTAAGSKVAAPSTNMGKVRRTLLPPAHAAVFDLQAGAVSQLFKDPNGFFIYKVQSKDTLPLEKVREEIRSTLQGQQVRDSMQAIQQSVTLDDDYFKAPAASAVPPGMPPHPAGPTGPTKPQ